MAYATLTRHAEHRSSLWSNLRADLSERLVRHRRYRQTLDELSWLSERDLTDLGIHRSQIREVAREASLLG